MPLGELAYVLAKPTSSPGRFSLAPPSKAREKRPGDEVVAKQLFGELTRLCLSSIIPKMPTWPRTPRIHSGTPGISVLRSPWPSTIVINRAK